MDTWKHAFDEMTWTSGCHMDFICEKTNKKQTKNGFGQEC
jgi:hypothetical protein